MACLKKSLISTGNWQGFTLSSDFLSIFLDV
jgi:hypothetical protein